MGIDLISSAFTYHERERDLLTLLRLKLFLINVDNEPTNEALLEKYAATGYQQVPIKGSCHFPMFEKPIDFNHLLQSVIEKIRLYYKSWYPEFVYRMRSYGLINVKPSLWPFMFPSGSLV